MIEQRKQNLYHAIDHLEFRRLESRDVVQFRNLFQESRESIDNFLNIGPTVTEKGFVDYLNLFSAILKDEVVLHFGLFHKNRMLAYGSLGPGFHPSGFEAIGLVRSSEMRKNLGTYMLYELMQTALLDLDADFVQVTIDKANIGSRSVAKILGFQSLVAMTAVGPGEKASDTQITYIKLNNRLVFRGTAYNKRPIDLIGHFCFIPGLEHLIHDSIVNEFFEWKHPIYQEDDHYLFSSDAGK